MIPVFNDYSFIKRLAEVIGAQKTIEIIQKNMRMRKGHLNSRDVHDVYDAQYTKMIADYPAAIIVNGIAVHYYAQFIFDFLSRLPGSKKQSVLDIGCGEGNLSLALASVGYDVTGIDYDQAAVSNAIEKGGRLELHGGSVRFEAKDVALISGRYDFIACSDVVEHLSLDELRAMLKKCAEILKDEGSILVHTPNGNMDTDQSRGAYWLIAKLRDIARIIYRRLTGVAATELELKHAYYQQVHIGVMTPDKLKKILHEAGFADVRFTFRQDRAVPFGGILASLGISSDMGLVARRKVHI
jgi:2-polyprenyl-3-methyl-5-hydroxy-6-metoxy-1,4-benzoquinol methylase